MSPVSLSLYDLWRTRAADDDGQGDEPVECRDCGAEPCPRHGSPRLARHINRRADALSQRLRAFSIGKKP